MDDKRKDIEKNNLQVHEFSTLGFVQQNLSLVSSFMFILFNLLGYCYIKYYLISFNVEAVDIFDFSEYFSLIFRSGINSYFYSFIYIAFVLFLILFIFAGHIKNSDNKTIKKTIKAIGNFYCKQALLVEVLLVLLIANTLYWAFKITKMAGIIDAFDIINDPFGYISSLVAFNHNLSLFVIISVYIILVFSSLAIVNSCKNKLASKGCRKLKLSVVTMFFLFFFVGYEIYSATFYQLQTSGLLIEKTLFNYKKNEHELTRTYSSSISKHTYAELLIPQAFEEISEEIMQNSTDVYSKGWTHIRLEDVVDYIGDRLDYYFKLQKSHYNSKINVDFKNWEHRPSWYDDELTHVISTKNMHVFYNREKYESVLISHGSMIGFNSKDVVGDNINRVSLSKFVPWSKSINPYIVE